MIIDLDARKVSSMKISLNYTQFTLPQKSWKTRQLKMYYEYVGARQERTINSACTLHTLTKRTMKMLQMENNQFHKKFRCRPKLIWPLVATFNYFRIRGINLNSLRVKHICIVWSGGWWLMLQAIFLFNWLVRVFRFINI